MEFFTLGFNLFLIIAGFGLLIFVHEAGHFLAAKWAGIRTEAFAVGFGRPIIAWRKGIGFRFGSTMQEYERRAREYMARNEPLPREDDGQPRTIKIEHIYRAGDALGLGETEYSLRWFFLGGFVKMLGQEDANPNYVSEDPRSYTRCPIGKRMVVISAGVVMNILLALALFVVAFLVGVQFEAPVVGSVYPAMPASTTMAVNAEALGVDRPGLLSGDRVLSIDGEPAETFGDIQVASAMGTGDRAIRLEVERSGLPQPLVFNLTPRRDPASNLLSFGVSPGASATLVDAGADGGLVEQLQVRLQSTGLAEAGVNLGMTLTDVKLDHEDDWRPISSFGQYSVLVEASNGRPMLTRWSELDSDDQPIGSAVVATIQVSPLLGQLVRQVKSVDGAKVYEYDLGVIGLSPLTRIDRAIQGSANEDILLAGDVVARAGDIDFPSRMQFTSALADHAGQEMTVVVLRDEKRVEVTCTVSRKGKLGVYISYALDLPHVARPINAVFEPPAPGQDRVERPTPVAPYSLMGGTRIISVNGQPTDDWAAIRAALLEATEPALDSDSPATVAMTIEHPTPDREHSTIELTLTAQDVAALHRLGWETPLVSVMFQPMYATLSADGNPIKAVAMGFERTQKLIVMTYLTIDRLFRGTVGVEQLRGPVGIVHIGITIADRGFMYIIFFLAMISVNLAVINFLPLPIVDGGLFLFLLYEKFKGRPPSIAFQNIATVVGLFLIATIFIVTFYNDIARLVTGS